MAETLTKDQKEAVYNRGGKLLVSAAAGSGKTKVLVDRLISYILDPVNPANIDDFLIITYTKAAAGELRGKIAAKLLEHIADKPENRHLQLQMQRLYLAKISTVHSFCADILRENAYHLDISADFRVADENECLELQLRSIDAILEESYATAQDDPDFYAFIDSQGFGRDDRQIPEIILKVYNSARCHLDPDAWLEWCIQTSDVSKVYDASETVWGRYLIDDLHNYLDLQISSLQRCISDASRLDGFEKPIAVITNTVSQLSALRAANTWDAIRSHINIDYGRLSFSKTCTDQDLTEQIKAVRDACKHGLSAKLRRFSSDSKQILFEMQQSSGATRGLIGLVRKFSSVYDKTKHTLRVMDFGDLEHKMLDLVLGKRRCAPTSAAVEIGNRFREVMVDEYQDTNAVQDAIFGALTEKRQNCFMVGDVKQSIYQFRLADPRIFLEKYDSYASADQAKNGQGRKVLLSSNFRSCAAVIDAVNEVFQTVMSPRVGGLEYTEAEALREGIPHSKLHEPEIELYGIDVQENTYPEEAAFVAQRIAELLDGTHLVRDGDAFRLIKPDDIVILLRSPGSVGGEYVSALMNKGIRCTTCGNSDLMSSEEIETLRSLLMVISNPIQDIPLIAVLSSRVFGFSADDLSTIRAENKRPSFYDALKSSTLPKATEFLNMLHSLRNEARMHSITKLISRIFSITRIDSIYGALDNGAERVDNLQSFYQIAATYEEVANNDLNRFLEHLEALEERGVAANMQKDSGAVTIMSIHKSKGLEFPVVFLCGLSRGFNSESARAQVLCDKELGLGLSCIDSRNRVRYPSIAKHAISCKILAEGLSEEMRVLYVAMTRARDRLIMTYAVKNFDKDRSSIALRLPHSDMLLLTTDADCPGVWVLISALSNGNGLLRIQPGIMNEYSNASCDGMKNSANVSIVDADTIKKHLDFSYRFHAATQIPSKQTATQLKGRSKDSEVSDNAPISSQRSRIWRMPSFVEKKVLGTEYGTAMHAVMQHISYEKCTDITGVDLEIARLFREGHLKEEQAQIVNRKQIADFFASKTGIKLRNAATVLREFKFTILTDASEFEHTVENEQILMQGVVDCALIEQDGITIIDFKTDRVTDETIAAVTQKYAPQVIMYADALARIYKLPIKEKLLYYFSANRFVDI